MTDQDALIACTVCGQPTPRADMFGVAPDLLCQGCRDGLNKRMQVRLRPISRDRPPYVTGFCLAAAVVLYVLTDMIARPGPNRPMPAWLAALHQAEPIWIGEVWRHLTCVFLHGGLWHLLMNGSFIWIIGRQVEAAWGHLAMAGLMVLTGMGASALQWMMTGPGVGMSGALFGLCGFLWALRRDHPVAAQVMDERMRRWLLTLLVIGVILTQTRIFPIGNWAHGGGLVLGYICGRAVNHALRRLWVPLTGLLVVAMLVASMYIALGSVPMRESDPWPRSQWRTYWLQQNARK